MIARNAKHPQITFRLYINGDLVYQPSHLAVLPRLNEDVEEWCEANLQHEWEYSCEINANSRPFWMTFASETDLIFFKMRWS